MRPSTWYCIEIGLCGLQQVDDGNNFNSNDVDHDDDNDNAENKEKVDVLVEDIVVEQEAGSALQAVESNCSDQRFHEEEDRDMELHDGNDDFSGGGDDNDDSSREKVAKGEEEVRKCGWEETLHCLRQVQLFHHHHHDNIEENCDNDEKENSIGNDDYDKEGPFG